MSGRTKPLRRRHAVAKATQIAVPDYVLRMHQVTDPAECHYLVGTSGYYPKEERRALEDELGRRTRQALIAAGTWPARVPMWKEEEPKG